MVIFLLCFLTLIAAGLFIAGRPYVASWLYKTFSDPEPYPPEAAEAPDPIEAAFTDARRIISGRLPTSSVDELVEQFDWPRYSTWLQDPAPKEMP